MHLTCVSALRMRSKKGTAVCSVPSSENAGDRMDPAMACGQGKEVMGSAVRQ